MGGELKRFFGLDRHEEPRSFESKYIRYKEKIEAFRKRFLNTEDIAKIFHNLAYDFTEVNPLQVGQTNSSKRMLIFGKDENGNDVRCSDDIYLPQKQYCRSKRFNKVHACWWI